jgi:hypothetical protein
MPRCWEDKPLRDELAAAVEGLLNSESDAEMQWQALGLARTCSLNIGARLLDKEWQRVERAVEILDSLAVRAPCEQGTLHESVSGLASATLSGDWTSKQLPHLSARLKLYRHQCPLIFEPLALQLFLLGKMSHAEWVSTNLHPTLAFACPACSGLDLSSLSVQASLRFNFLSGHTQLGMATEHFLSYHAELCEVIMLPEGATVTAENTLAEQISDVNYILPDLDSQCAVWNDLGEGITLRLDSPKGTKSILLELNYLIVGT